MTLKWNRLVSDSEIESVMPMAVKMGLGYWGKHNDAKDWISIAYIGLMKAANSFLPEKGAKFSTYAFNAIRRELWKEKNKENAYKRQLEEVELKDRYAALGCDLDMLIDLREAMQQLNSKQRTCIKMWSEGITPSEIAKELGYKSRQGADLLRSRTFEKLKEILNDENPI